MQAGGKLWKRQWYAGGIFGGMQGIEGRELTRSATFAPDVVPDPKLNRWYHMVGIWDATHTRIYIDGKLDAITKRTTQGPLYDVPGTKMVIGNCATKNRVNWTDYYFDGLIDEVRIYRRALSETEVSELFEQAPGNQ